MEVVLRPAVLLASAAVYAGRVDLPLPDPSLCLRAEAALARRNLAVDLGVVVGIATAAVLTLVLGAPQGLTGDTGATRDGLWALIVAGAALAGAATGAAWAGAGQARHGAPAPGPRVARPTASDAPDHIAPLELWGARLMALAPAVTLAIGVSACFALLVAASAGVGDPTIANGLIGLGVFGLAAIAVVSAASRPQRHFRQRLWPRDGASYPSVGLPNSTGGPR